MRIGELTLADRFHYCKAKRQKADYDINESLTETEAEDQIRYLVENDLEVLNIFKIKMGK